MFFTCFISNLLTLCLFSWRDTVIGDNSKIDNVVDFNAEVNTMFLAWFEANKTYAEDKELTYVEFTTILV